MYISLKKTFFSLVCLLGFSWNIFASWNISPWNLLDNSFWKISDKDFVTEVRDANFWKTFGNNNYRWALPKPESIDILKNTYHVTTIISLLPKNQMSKSLQKKITESWMTRIVVPLSKYAPKKADRDIILAALKKWNVYVHCKYWADRTGAIIARARVELEKKNPDGAYKDMLLYNAKVEKIKAYKESFKYLKYFIYNWI